MIDSTQLTADEIKKYREQFTQYQEQLKYDPEALKNSKIPEALQALELIDECSGDLEEVLKLSLKEQFKDDPRAIFDLDIDIDQLAQGCRTIVCADLSRTILEIFNILTGLFGPTGVAMAILLYILNKYGLENYCQNSD